MKSIDLRHRLAAVLLAMCLVVCCALPAFATSANIVLGRLGSLHVRLYDTHNDVPLRGGELTLYQVATVKRTNGNLYFDYTGDFTGCGVVLGDLLDGARQHVCARGGVGADRGTNLVAAEIGVAGQLADHRRLVGPGAPASHGQPAGIAAQRRGVGRQGVSLFACREISGVLCCRRRYRTDAAILDLLRDFS